MWQASEKINVSYLELNLAAHIDSWTQPRIIIALCFGQRHIKRLVSEAPNMIFGYPGHCPWSK